MFGAVPGGGIDRTGRIIEVNRERKGQEERRRGRGREENRKRAGVRERRGTCIPKPSSSQAQVDGACSSRAGMTAIVEARERAMPRFRRCHKHVFRDDELKW